MKPRNFSRASLFLSATLLFTHSAQAADLTWDNGASTGNWNTSDANFGGFWTNGNTAVFGGTAGSTVTINEAAISAVGLTFNVNDDIIAQSGGNNLTLTSTGLITLGSGKTATINAPLAGTAGMVVDGGGTLNLGGVSTIDGGGNGALGLIVGATTASNTVNLSNGGTMGTISANRRSIYIGSSNAAAGLATTNGNVVNISTPGSSVTPSFNASGNGGQVTIGYASDNNELNVSNGAYVAQTNGGGTNTWSLGVIAGADGNKLTVSGTNSKVVFTSSPAVVVGGAGNSNTATISAGGLMAIRRWQVGQNGGDSNAVLVTGTNSVSTNSETFSASGNTNAVFEIGNSASATGNSFTVESGGRLFLNGGRNDRSFSIGGQDGADGNYLRATGSTSILQITSQNPLSIGGTFVGIDSGTAGLADDSTAANNHVDIYSGATATFNSIYLQGTNSSVKLGNGTGISTATVGLSSAANATAGIALSKSDSKVSINSGRLIASTTGSLVSGTGVVDLVGDAYVSNASGTNTISTEITGSGDFTKEGTGTLDLTYVTSFGNTYTGDTIVDEGVLKINSAYLANAAAVRMFPGGVLNLNFPEPGGDVSDTVAALYFDNTPQAGGTWGATGSGATNINDTYFSGPGMLFVNAIPEPASILLGGLGMLTLLRRRRDA